MKKIVLTYFIFLVLMSLVDANDKIGEEINRQVISSGGNMEDSSANYHLRGSMAQTVTGGGNSAGHKLNHGFWQGIGTACDCYPGNANADSAINIFDITYIISFLYVGGPLPTPYELCNGDPNRDCICNIFDIAYIIGFLYMDGPPPCNCEEWITTCGPLLRK